MRISPGLKVLGFDDGPFPSDWTGPVLVVGAMYHGGEFLEGVLCTHITKDGDDATERLIAAVTGSRFQAQLHGLLLHGVTLGGFNVVDLPRLHHDTGRPVLSVMRKEPDLAAMQAALAKVPNGAAKWERLRAAGPVRELNGLFVQPHGLSDAEAQALLRLITRRGKFPEPLRAAHLIAGGLATGESRGRP
jgi:endonuclease V-like protein UPF0215 family